MRPPAPLLDELVAAAQVEQAAARAVMEARQVLTYAGRRLTAAVAHLQGAGIPTTVVAFHVAQAMGLPATVEDRLRLAARLRKRASRARDTGSRTSSRPTGTAAIAAEHSSNGKEAITMAKITRRKITEEWEEQAEPGEDLANQDVDEVDEDEEEEEEEQEEKRMRRKRR